MANNKPFLLFIHYFRAFAIINVVACHLFHSPFQNNTIIINQTISITREVLFHDSTIYFIFVSGFLFEYLSDNFQTLKYYQKKISFVIIPYILISTLIIFEDYLRHPTNTKFFTILPKTLMLGTANIQFWYIPFISLVFLASPLFLKIPYKMLKLLIYPLSIIPILGMRNGVDAFSVGQYIYFIPIYLIGLICASNIPHFIAFIKRTALLFSISAIISTLILIDTFLTDFSTITSPPEGLFYIQKISIQFVALNIFVNIQDRNISLLNLIANYSFPLYFYHVFISYKIHGILKHFSLNSLSVYPFTTATLYVLATILVTLLLCLLLKKVLGKYSKFLTGA